MKSIPLPKTEIIERSIKCFGYGLFGLIPLLGVPMALTALVQSWRVQRARSVDWNPGHRYRFWGAMFARIGLGLTLILACLIAYLILRPWEP